MDKVQKHNSFNTNTPSSESYRNYQKLVVCRVSLSSLKCPQNPPSDPILGHLNSIPNFTRYIQIFIYTRLLRNLLQICDAHIFVRAFNHFTRIEQVHVAVTHCYILKLFVLNLSRFPHILRDSLVFSVSSPEFRASTLKQASIVSFLFCMCLHLTIVFLSYLTF
jgi:hypothetical protein